MPFHLKHEYQFVQRFFFPIKSTVYKLLNLSKVCEYKDTLVLEFLASQLASLKQ